MPGDEQAPFPFNLQGGNKPSALSGGTAHILPEERARASFPVEKMTNFIDGSAERTKKRRWIIAQTLNDDYLGKVETSRADQIQVHVKSFIDIHKEFAEKGYIPERWEVAFMSINSVHKGALMNHYGLFLPTLLGQASPEQLMTWAPATLTFQMIGSYAQTELGHGSNVRGLQTEATYDEKTQQFILNTPTLTSMKWWPGALGKIATHAVVYAQLILKNRAFGLHVFLVQIRDANHNPLLGIELGDLGIKLGDHANDTGYMRMTEVRIPREHMLAKGAVVTPDGRYLKTKAKKENPVMHYATMMQARAGMMGAAGGILAAGATIAVRYSAVRTQGFADSGAETFQAAENKIIDYQVQRYRLLKEVALAYAITLTGNWLSEKVSILSTGSLDAKNIIDALPEIHASAAGLKALCTGLTANGLEELRKCCGGNGYLLSSGIAKLTQDYAWQVTAEGDYIVLLLQTARFLVKSLEQARRGEPVVGLVKLLEPLRDKAYKIPQPARAKSTADFKNPAFLEALFRYRALTNIVACGDELELGAKRGMTHDQAWNHSALNLVTTAKSHCHWFMITQFKDQVNSAKGLDPALGRVLNSVCALYGVSEILDGQQWTGVLDANEATFLHRACSELLDELRGDAVALVDAFDIPDRVLNSNIGRKDGNVYEALYASAKMSTLNKHEVFEGYKEYLQPHLNLELLANENKTPLMDIHVDESECTVDEGLPLAKL